MRLKENRKGFAVRSKIKAGDTGCAERCNNYNDIRGEKTACKLGCHYFYHGNCLSSTDSDT